MELSCYLYLYQLTCFPDKSNGEILQEPEMFANRSSTVTLTCQHDNSDHYRLFWYKQAKGTVGLSLLVFSAGQNQAYIEEPFKTQDSKYAATRPEIKMSTLQINNLETEDSALYYCYNPAYFGNGTKLTVLAANVTLPKVKILPPSPKEICSQDKINDKRSTLVCVASGFYPDHVSVSWKVNGVARQDSVSTDTSAQQDKTTLMYHISSRIKVNDTDWMDLKSSFACTVQFFNGDEYVNVTNTINGQKGL
uniref:Ig-like domain-containing protein n=1 Tax=Sinocyclocheilus rhinocerous TaxID=307959 RepID=A0A673NQU0_9TELE